MSDHAAQPESVPPDATDMAVLFPGYEFEGLIASGGMGSVYRAVQRSLERPVAIKILAREFSHDEVFRAIFEAEAKAMAKLNHPNLIGVYDFGEVAGMLYIIMEYVPGHSLFHSAHGMAVDPSEVVRLVCAICSGLAHAHENGIIHRDIKPSNILLDLEARPKIGDFGLARSSGQTVLEGEEIFGTPHYTAPEVVNAPQSVDHRADIFSLGVMLHELLTGRLPADDPRPPSAICQCDPRFDAIVRRATDVQPERRYPSAAEIARELQTIATTPGPKVLRTTPPRKPLPVGRRARRPQPVASSGHSSRMGLIVLLLIAISFAAMLYRYLTEKNRTQAAETTGPRIIRVQQPEAPKPEPQDPGPSAEDPEPQQEIADSPPPEIVQPMPEPSVRNEEDEAKPKFDVADFLDNRARKIMRERTQPLLAARDAELAKNLAACERDFQNAARREGRTALRDAYADFIKKFIVDCREDGNLLPEDVPEDIEDIAGASALHARYLRKQEAIQQKLQRDLALLSDTYILGIGKQIERLKEADDPVAIRMLEEEIEAVRGGDDYFAGLMLGE